jgi:Rieske Fe-S protein
MSTSRRDFLRASWASAALLALGFDLAACDAADPVGGNPPPGNSGISINGATITLDLTGTQARAVAGAGGFLLIASAHTLVVNPDGAAIRAFTSVCTHQGCDVNRFAEGRLHCPCHGSQYDVNGQVVVGPAPLPLREFPVSRAGDLVTITTS